MSNIPPSPFFFQIFRSQFIFSYLFNFHYFLANYFDLFLIHYFLNKNCSIMFLDVPGVLRLMCGTADRGTAEPAEPTEPKEMTVLLQLLLVNVIK